MKIIHVKLIIKNTAEQAAGHIDSYLVCEPCSESIQVIAVHPGFSTRSPSLGDSWVPVWQYHWEELHVYIKIDTIKIELSFLLNWHQILDSFLMEFFFKSFAENFRTFI